MPSCMNALAELCHSLHGNSNGPNAHSLHPLAHARITERMTIVRSRIGTPAHIAIHTAARFHLADLTSNFPAVTT